MTRANNLADKAAKPKSSRPRTSDQSHESSDEALTYLLRQVSERLARSLTEALRPFDQSSSVYRVLIALTRRDPARVSDLAELTLIESSTLSRTLDRMEADGLVQRIPGSDDGRTVLITTTQKGQAFLEEILPMVSIQFDWSIHNVPKADLEAMRRTLKLMLRNLKFSPIK